MDIYDKWCNRGVPDRWGGQMYVTLCDDYTNYSQEMAEWVSLIALDMLKINQNDIICSFRGETDF